MNIEDIIKKLNDYIVNVRKYGNIKTKGHLILHKSIIPDATFKAIKHVTFTLWFVNNRKQYKVLIQETNEKILVDQKDAVIERLSLDFIEKIFALMESECFKLIVNGEYTDGIQ